MGEKPQSKFWAGSEGSESESENEKSSSSEEVPQQKQEDKSKYAAYDESASESDEGQRIVKSARGKAEEAFERVYKEITNAIKINDWNSISTSHGKLSALLTKHAEAITSASSTTDPYANYPDYYFLCLKAIQDQIAALNADKPALKKLSKTNGKSFNALKARMKKSITAEIQDKIDNVDVQQQKKTEGKGKKGVPVVSQSESSSEESEDSESEESEEEEEEDEEESDESDSSEEEDWDKDSSSTSEDDEEDEEMKKLSGRAKWVKRVKVVDKDKIMEEKRQKEKDKQERAKQRKVLKEQTQEESNQTQNRLKAKGLKEDEELTVEKIEEMMQGVMSSRGKKGVNRLEIIQQMRTIAERCAENVEELGAKAELQAKINLISLQFDVNSGLDEFMPISLWKEVVSDVRSILDILNSNQNIRLIPYARLEAHTNDDGGENDPTVPITIVGDLTTIMDRISNEYEKSLRYLDSHSKDYVARLRDEAVLCDLAKDVFSYLIGIDQYEKAASQCLIILEHNYYKHEDVAFALQLARFISAEDTEAEREKKTSEVRKSFNLELIIKEDTEFIFEHGNEEMKCTAMLCLIYHYAIHDNFFKARDLLLMSRLQDTIYTTDIETQILFNRMILQVGICAFRAGKVKDSYNCLMEICQQGNKTKELIAQGIHWRKITPNVDQKALEARQKAERRRLMPYHMHISLDMLEFFSLVASMLVEIPKMAKNELNEDENLRNSSRNFRRLLEQYSRQVFTGPPENTRDHVLAACLALKEGNWSKCLEYLLDLPVWGLIPYAEKTKKVLIEQVKQESLRTYLLTYSAIYSSIGLAHLSELFQLGQQQVRETVSWMIVGDEIKASWDEITECVVFHRNELTHVQALALRCAEKLQKIVEENENKANAGTGVGFDSMNVRKNQSVRTK